MRLAYAASHCLVDRNRLRAVEIEFDRYIAAGDLAQTKQRIEQLQAQSDQKGGFVGMYL